MNAESDTTLKQAAALVQPQSEPDILLVRPLACLGRCPQITPRTPMKNGQLIARPLLPRLTSPNSKANSNSHTAEWSDPAQRAGFAHTI